MTRPARGAARRTTTEPDRRRGAFDLLPWVPGTRSHEQRLLAAELDDDMLRAALVREMWPKRAVEEAVHVQLSGQLERMSAQVLSAAEALDSEHAQLRYACVACRVLESAGDRVEAVALQHQPERRQEAIARSAARIGV